MNNRPTTTTIWRTIFWSRWFLLFAFILALAVAAAFAHAYYQDYQVRQEINHLQSQVKNLQLKKIESLELLDYVKSDDFVEQTARTELNLQKPGEQSAFVPVLNLGGRQVVASVVQSKDNISNLAKWWRLFFHPRSE